MLPLEILEKCRGVRVLVILSGNIELEGILSELDTSCNLVLRDAASYRTVRAPSPGQRDRRERTGEFSLLLVPCHAIEMIVPGGAQANIVSTIAVDEA